MKPETLKMLFQKAVHSACETLSKSEDDLMQLRIIEQLLSLRTVLKSPEHEIPDLHTLIQYGCTDETRAKTLEAIRSCIATRRQPEALILKKIPPMK